MSLVNEMRRNRLLFDYRGENTPIADVLLSSGSSDFVSGSAYSASIVSSTTSNTGEYMLQLTTAGSGMGMFYLKVDLTGVLRYKVDVGIAENTVGSPVLGFLGSVTGGAQFFASSSSASWVAGAGTLTSNAQGTGGGTPSGTKITMRMFADAVGGATAYRFSSSWSVRQGSTSVNRLMNKTVYPASPTFNNNSIPAYVGVGFDTAVAGSLGIDSIRIWAELAEGRR